MVRGGGAPEPEAPVDHVRPVVVLTLYLLRLQRIGFKEKEWHKEDEDV